MWCFIRPSNENVFILFGLKPNYFLSGRGLAIRDARGDLHELADVSIACRAPLSNASYSVWGSFGLSSSTSLVARGGMCSLKRQRISILTSSRLPLTARLGWHVCSSWGSLKSIGQSLSRRGSRKSGLET